MGRSDAAAWDTRACSMALPALQQSCAVEDGSEMGRFTLDPASWEVSSTTSDGQVPAVTAGTQTAWPKPQCHPRKVPHHRRGGDAGSEPQNLPGHGSPHGHSPNALLSPHVPSQ